MRLLLNGDEIDLKAPHELMNHLGRLRAEQHADLRIEADSGATMCLLKNGDRALVRYMDNAGGQAFLARSGSEEESTVQFHPADGEVEKVPESMSVDVMMAYQALVHFIRAGGMSESLDWQQAA